MQTKTPLETAQSVATRLYFLIECTTPRGSIGPLGFAEECEAVIKGIKFCIDNLPPVKDLETALYHMHEAKEAYAEYYNGHRLGDLNSCDIVGCMKDMCCLNLRLARATLVRAISNNQLGE